MRTWRFYNFNETRNAHILFWSPKTTHLVLPLGVDGLLTRTLGASCGSVEAVVGELTAPVGSSDSTS